MFKLQLFIRVRACTGSDEEKDVPLDNIRIFHAKSYGFISFTNMDIEFKP